MLPSEMRWPWEQISVWGWPVLLVLICLVFILLVNIFEGLDGPSD